MFASRRSRTFESLETRTLLTVTLVEDINSLANQFDFEAFVQVNDVVYFTNESASGGGELWKSDGTAENTNVVAELDEAGEQLTYVSDKVFFKSNNAIWATDVASGTTERITLGNQHSSVGRLTAFGDSIAFVTERDKPSAVARELDEIWISDGTTAGTHVIPNAVFESGDLRLRSKVDIRSMSEFGDQLYLVRGTELWKTDGLSGIELVSDFSVGGMEAVEILHADAAGMWVSATSYSTGEGELWKLAIGQDEPTMLAAFDGFANFNGSAPGNANVFFNVRSPQGDSDINEVWATDGTAAGTSKIDFERGENYLVAQLDSNEALLSADGEDRTIWRTNLATAESVMIGDLSDSGHYSNRYGSAVWNDSLYLLELSTGPGPMTNLLRYDDDSGIEFLGNVGNQARSELFVVNDRLFVGTRFYDGPQSLWVSDGTANGTLAVTDIEELGGAGSNVAHNMTVGDKLIHVATTPEGSNLLRARAGDGTTEPIGELAREVIASVSLGEKGLVFAYADDVLQITATDGTATGTELIYELPPNFERPGFVDGYEVAGGKLFASFFVEGEPTRLFVTDGSAEGSGFIEGITSGPAPTDLRAVGDIVYFQAADELRFDIVPTNRELWRSDGTVEGTFLVADLDPATPPQHPIDIDGSFPNNIIPVGTEFFFLADEEGDTWLWKSSGTAETTEKFGDLPESSDHLVYSNGNIFSMARANSGALQLWATDADGNAVVLEQYDELPPISEISKTIGDNLIFVASLDGQTSLWQSDGTLAGTKPFHTLGEGKATGESTALNGLMYFSFDSSEFGEELWVTDGTSSGTYMYDINPGSASSSPNSFVEWNGELYFSADDGQTGRELWRANGRLLFAGDLTGDGQVGFEDFLILSANFGMADASVGQGDLDGDTNVGFSDFLILSENFGRTQPAEANPMPTHMFAAQAVDAFFDSQFEGSDDTNDISVRNQYPISR